MAHHSLLSRPIVLGIVVISVAVVGGYLIFKPDRIDPPPPSNEEDELVLDPPTPDPRLTFQTIFQNVKPDVRYVGDTRCADCHDDICKSYHAHPMGRSAAEVKGSAVIEKYDTKANNPGKVGPYELRVTTADGFHRVSAKDSSGAALPEYTIPANLAIGSGTRGRSYLSITQGAVWQSPISWFTTESRWDVSPGFDLGTGARRPITSECLFCHVNRVEPIPQTLNRYREPLVGVQAAIGCERCHGPGELHATERSAGRGEKVDTSIVNPKHLPPALQSAICEQCHLQGQERVARRGRDVYEFRPGLPFEQFVTVFVRHPDLADAHKSVGQFEQLEQSKCFTASGGRLVCTKCHEPHSTPTPADRERFYRDRCNTCHETKGCSAPAPQRQSKNDSCMACHMPRVGSSNIAHASITDHRILRRPVPPPPPRGLPPSATPLVTFRKTQYIPPDEERERDLGIALARLASRIGPGSGSTRQLVGGLARDRLSVSLGVWRGDPDAWLAMSLARGACGEPNERLKAAEAAIRLTPQSELALAEFAEAALGVGLLDRAEESATRVIGMNPTSVDYLLTRASVFAGQKRWDKAEEDCRAALRIQPLHPQARLMLGICLHHRGNPEAGRKEAQTAIGLATHPRQKTAFQQWYQQETR
ncbi:MAG: tetratricopeptide repeat protein [Planctomycetia bacterium]|nr:tetratricopeptide repeat protein [Planctomycetia bacterium]